MILENYRIIEKIHENNKTVVYKAIRKADGEEVAIKTSSKTFADRFENEQIIHDYELSKIFSDYDGFLKIYELIRLNNKIYKVMEYFEGETIESLLSSEKIFSIEEFIDLALKLVEALGEIHKKDIVHKEINPKNVLWNRDNKTLKIIDFSNASKMIKKDMNQFNYGDINNHIYYISPEQTGRVNRYIDYRSDYYSVGIMFYEMLTGKKPFISDDVLEIISSHVSKMPESPKELNQNIPDVLSDVILKLIAKNPEERYQSMYGIKYDLIKIKENYRNNKNQKFVIAQKDISDHLQISQKIYGRKKELDEIKKVLLKTISDGKKRIVTIFGEYGLGKTKLAREIEPIITNYGGFFVSGKYEKNANKEPYKGLRQVFNDLYNCIVSMPQDEFNQWKEQLRKKLNGIEKIALNFMPELEKVLQYERKTESENYVDGSNSLESFLASSEQFVDAFLSIGRPIVMFIDEIQWADEESLKLLEYRLTNKPAGKVMLIFAIRSEEYGKENPVNDVLEKFKMSGIEVLNINLLPLNVTDIIDLLSEVFKCNPEKVEQLAKICLDKTRGNPYFLTEFIKNQYEMSNIFFKDGLWCWNIEKMWKSDTNENHIEMLENNINMLDDELKRVLMTASCFGNTFELEMLSKVMECDSLTVLSYLTRLIAKGFLYAENKNSNYSNNENIVLEERYCFKFIDENVYKVSNNMLAESSKKNIHIKIGRLYLKEYNDNKKFKHAIEITKYLNDYLDDFKTDEELKEAAKINYYSGLNMLNVNNFSYARKFFDVALSILKDDWVKYYDILFDVYIAKSKCECLLSNFDSAHLILDSITDNLNTKLDLLKLYDVRLQILIAQNKRKDVVNSGIDMLDAFGIKINKNPSKSTVLLEFIKFRAMLSKYSYDDFINKTAEDDEFNVKLFAIFRMIGVSAYWNNINIVALVSFKAIEHQLKNGVKVNLFISFMCYSFALLLMGLIDEGIKYAEIAEKMYTTTRYQKEDVPCYLFVKGYAYNHLKLPLIKASEFLEKAYDEVVKLGDKEFASLMLVVLNAFKINTGYNLNDFLNKAVSIYEKIEKEFNQKSTAEQFKVLIYFAYSCIYGEEEKFKIGEKEFYISAFNKNLMKIDNRMALATFYRAKIIINYLHDKVKVLDIIIARKCLGSIKGTYYYVSYLFYESLSIISIIDRTGKIKNLKFLFDLAANLKKLEKYSNYAPQNYLHQYLIIKAQMEKLLGNYKSAGKLFMKAIEVSKNNGITNEYALANELFGKYLITMNLDLTAYSYLAEGRDCYRIWGAYEKVRLLEKRYPKLLEYTNSKKIKHKDESDLNNENLISSNMDLPDVVAVLKSSQAISGEIEYANLIERLMKILLENTGANKVKLLIKKDLEFKVEAEYTSVDESVIIFGEKDNYEFPKNIVNYVERTHKIYVHNTDVYGQFENDEYIKEYSPKSLLCMPIIYRGELKRILLAENSMSYGVFNEKRIEALKLLSSQIAISIYTNEIYEELKKSRDDIQDMNRTLEERIAERTEELVCLNAELEASNTELMSTIEILQKAQKQLVESEKMVSLGRLVAGVAHEINTPIGVSYTAVSYINKITDEFIDLYKNNQVKRSNIERYIDSIKESSEIIYKNLEKASGIITSFKRVSVDMSSEDPREFNMYECIKNVLITLKPKIKHTNIDTEIYCQEDIVIYSYPGSISQILTNFIENTILHGFDDERKGTITIEFNVENEKGILIYRDTGKGIGKDIIDKIFEPFFTTARNSGGTGLGLNIVYNIVAQRLGGTIKCESETGKGTKFIIEFPIKNASLEESESFELVTN